MMHAPDASAEKRNIDSGVRPAGDDKNDHNPVFQGNAIKRGQPIVHPVRIDRQADAAGSAD
jgi:hypothetical protein